MTLEEFLDQLSDAQRHLGAKASHVEVVIDNPSDWSPDPVRKVRAHGLQIVLEK